MKKLLPFFCLLILVSYITNVFGQAGTTVNKQMPVDSAEKIKKIQHIIDFCTRAINSKSQDKAMLIQTYAVRGMNFLALKEFKKALSDYNSVISLNPKFVDAYVYQAAAYEGLKDYQSAVNDYEKALTYLTNNLAGTALLYNSISLAQKNIRQFDKAIESSSQAIALAPNFGGAYATRGELYGLTRQYQLAINDLTTAMGGYQNNKKLLSILFSERADMKRALKQYKDAINDYSTAIELNPDNRLAYWNRAASYNQNGDYELASNDYTKAISYFKGDSKSLSRLYDDRALMEMGQQQYRKAIADDSMAIALDNKFAVAYWNKADGYAQNADFQLSIDAYTRTMNFYQYDKRALAQLFDNIANEEYFLNDYDKVIDYSSSSIAINSKSCSPYLNRGRAYLKKMRKDSAMSDFNKVLTLDTTKTSFDYAFALFYTGNPDKAVEVMQNNVIATTNNVLLRSHYYNLACLFSLMNKPDEANIYLKRCIDGGYSKKYVLADPDLDNIRNTPGYKDAMR